MEMDGVQIKTGSSYGTYIEVYDKTGQHYESKFYAKGNTDFDPFINSIPDDYVILVGVHGSAVSGIASFDIFNNCGS